MTSTFDYDYKYGKENELNILPLITSFFNRDIKLTTDKYCKYDFYDTKYKYEVKSRRNNVNTYHTTLISSDKTDKNTILLFNFTDGLYYIEYNKKQFEKYENKNFQRVRPGHTDINKLYVYIPTNELKLIAEYYTELDF